MSDVAAMSMSDVSVRATTVVLGLGNRFGGDDAVGPLVAAGIADRLPDIPVVEGSGDAMAIVAAWEGFKRVIVVDAASGDAPPGTVHRFADGSTLTPKKLARCSSHGGGLAEALALAEALGRTPTELIVFAVEAASFEPGAPLSDEVSEVLGPLTDRIVAEIDDRRTRRPSDTDVEQ